MNVYLLAALQHPSDKDARDGVQPSLALQFTTIAAKNRDSAIAQAATKLPKDAILDRIEWLTLVAMGR